MVAANPSNPLYIQEAAPATAAPAGDNNCRIQVIYIRGHSWFLAILMSKQIKGLSPRCIQETAPATAAPTAPGASKRCVSGAFIIAQPTLYLGGSTCNCSAYST